MGSVVQALSRAHSGWLRVAASDSMQDEQLASEWHSDSYQDYDDSKEANNLLWENTCMRIMR